MRLKSYHDAVAFVNVSFMVNKRLMNPDKKLSAILPARVVYLHSLRFALTLSGFALRSVKARIYSRSLFAPWEKLTGDIHASDRRALQSKK